MIGIDSEEFGIELRFFCCTAFRERCARLEVSEVDSRENQQKGRNFFFCALLLRSIDGEISDFKIIFQQ